MASKRDRKKLLKKTFQRLKELAEWMEDDLRENLLENNVTNKLSRSVKVTFDEKKFIISLSFAEYGIYLEEGTKPHWTSVRNLQSWANAKGLNVYAVQRNIAKFGTKPHPWLYTWDDFVKSNKLEKLIGSAVEKDIDDWFVSVNAGLKK